MDINYTAYLQELLRSKKIDFLGSKQFYQQKSQTIVQKQQLKAGPMTLNLTPPLQGNVLKRYIRQMLLKEVKYEGQLKIMASKVAIIGAGGIGCPLALYIAAAGIGTIGIFDSDVVDLTNLHRQIGHTTDRIGIAKTESLKETLLGINPTIRINEHPAIDLETAPLLEDYDIIVDGSDNPKCRYYVNDYCMKANKKLLSGACIGWEGQVTCYGNGSATTDNPCYRCLWGDDQLSLGGCSSLGVIGMVPAIVGEILGVEVLKIAINSTSSLEGQLLTFDAKNMQFRKMKLRNRKDECLACGKEPLDMKTYEYSKYTGCGMSCSLPEVPSISWQEYINKSKIGETTAKLVDVRSSAAFGVISFTDSISIPYDELKKMGIEDLNKLGIQIDSDKKIVGVSCQRGIISKLGTDHLSKLGFNAVNLAGGIDKYGEDYDSRAVQL